jgi:glutamyl-tRNA reductase
VIDQLGMLGISWRESDSAALTEFTLDREQSSAALRNFARRHALTELAYLATCNRVELLFARSATTPDIDLRAEAFELLTGHSAAPGEAQRRLKAWQGEGAAEHLFLVAAGLDSACLGETEIIGQVRQCHTHSLSLGLCGSTLDILFRAAEDIAARVRTTTALASGRVSLAEIAVELLRERHEQTGGTVALIGVSPMTERAALSLHGAGVPLLIVNRTVSKAALLADQFNAEHIALANFIAQPPALDAVLCATGAPGLVLDGAALARLRAASTASPLIIDMAVPPDVAIDACKNLGMRWIGMDEITARAERNRAKRLTEAAQAREYVDNALLELHERYTERHFGPLLGTLQQRYQRTAREGIVRLLKKDLAGLGEDERAAIERWSEVMARRFAHIPCLGLRGLMQYGPEGSVDAFINGLEPEFADELRSALNRDRETRLPNIES